MLPEVTMKNQNIAKVLKTYRKENQLSVNDVSNLLQSRSITAAPKTIYGWESGRTQPDADTLLILCELYHINDILGTFGYIQPQDIFLTSFEKDLIRQYRNHPEMQDAVKKLLGL